MAGSTGRWTENGETTYVYGTEITDKKIAHLFEGGLRVWLKESLFYNIMCTYDARGKTLSKKSAHFLTVIAI